MTHGSRTARSACRLLDQRVLPMPAGPTRSTAPAPAARSTSASRTASSASRPANNQDDRGSGTGDPGDIDGHGPHRVALPWNSGTAWNSRHPLREGADEELASSALAAGGEEPRGDPRRQYSSAEDGQPRRRRTPTLDIPQPRAASPRYIEDVTGGHRHRPHRRRRRRRR